MPTNVPTQIERDRDAVVLGISDFSLTSTCGGLRAFIVAIALGLIGLQLRSLFSGP